MGKLKEIKFSRSLKWLKPFLESVSDIIPIAQIDEVLGYKYPLHHHEDAYAICDSYNDGLTFSVQIKTHEHVYEMQQTMKEDGTPVKKQIVCIPTMYAKRLASEILFDFAHELAHIPTWHNKTDHDWEHFSYMLQILTRFNLIITKVGFKNLEIRRGLKIPNEIIPIEEG